MESGKDNLTKLSIYSAVLFYSIIVIAIVIFLVTNSYPVFIEMKQYFLFGEVWSPEENIFGALPMIIGSFYVTVLSVLFATPLAIGSAIFVSEFIPENIRIFIKTIVELLAGIPSIVYGLIGIIVLSEIVKNGFNLIDGSCILTAAIVVGIMILPIIMTVSEDALHNVNHEEREASFALGFSRTEVLKYTVFPSALPGIVSSLLLGIGRALGETMAVMLVIGSIDKLPVPLFNILLPSQTITSKLGQEAAESLGAGLHWNALVGLGVLLFAVEIIIVLCIPQKILTNTSIQK